MRDHKKRREERRIRRIFEQNPAEVGADGKIDGRRAAEDWWRAASFELRMRIIEEAGWDSAGWIFRNWRELPIELQLDVKNGFVKLAEKELAELAKKGFRIRAGKASPQQEP